MMKCTFFIAFFFLILMPRPHVRAQPVDPVPIVEITIDRERVIVGQPVTVSVVVLAPNYMTSQPELPTFQLRNAVTRQLPSINVNDQRNGLTYSGVHFAFAVYPQEAGDFAIPENKVRIRYAAEPPATRDVEIAMSRVGFEAFVPDGAAGLRPFLSARVFAADQTVKQSSETLKAGHAITRTVTITAQDAPAILLPPHKFAAIAGLRLYPVQPVLEENVEGRTGVMSSSRVDSATYMIEHPGNYTFPEIDIGWWNVARGRIEQVHLPVVNLSVDGTASDGGSASRWDRATISDLIAEHRLLAIFALIALATLALFAPSAMRCLTALIVSRREAYRASETWSYRQLRFVARHGKAEAVYFALLRWLRRFEPLQPASTPDALIAAADDPVLAAQIDALRSELFASGSERPKWSAATLMRHVARARRKLRRKTSTNEAAMALPAEINPVGIRVLAFENRRVAR